MWTDAHHMQVTLKVVDVSTQSRIQLAPIHTLIRMSHVTRLHDFAKQESPFLLVRLKGALPQPLREGRGVRVAIKDITNHPC